MEMLALTGCSGKIGGAVLDSLLRHSLLPPSSLVICTSSSSDHPKFAEAKQKGVQIRQSNYDDFASMVTAFKGCSSLFLVSTPKISLDYNDAPYGKGREGQHFNAINAAVEAGVKHIYYTSLAFGDNSVAGAMRAHLRTETYLAGLREQNKLDFTILREGLYNESWSVYLGFNNLLKTGDLEEAVIAGDGPVSWTSIADLGFASAVILAANKNEYRGKTLYLSNTDDKPIELKEVAQIVSSITGRNIKVKILGRQEFIEYHVGTGTDRAGLEWAVGAFEAIERKECEIHDKTFSNILKSKGVVPTPLEKTIKWMVEAGLFENLI